MTPDRIPDHYHFVFGLREGPEPLHLVHYLSLRSCLEVNRPSRVTVHSPRPPQGPYWERIRSDVEWAEAEPVPLVRDFRYPDRAINPYRYAHHSDFVRLDRLLEHGGVYADLDTLFVRPMPAALFEKPFVLGREADIADPRTGEPRRSLCNAVIFSRPGSAFGRRWRAGLEDAFDGTWSHHSTLFPQRLAERHPDEIHIEPEESFFSFPPTLEGLSRLFDASVPIPDDAYSLHLWAHLWWSPRRLDFSYLSAEGVTEDFVRRFDSTFCLAARPFLPERGVVASGAGGTSSDLRSSEEKLESEPVQLFEDACARLGITEAFERSIVGNVIVSDEYGLQGRVFSADDVILDVGAHLGAFSLFCHHLGARRICAFEADPCNARRLERAFGNLEGLYVDGRAVFRSDLPGPIELEHSGPTGVNTGSGNVLLGGRDRRLSRSVGLGSPWADAPRAGCGPG